MKKCVHLNTFDASAARSAEKNVESNIVVPSIVVGPVVSKENQRVHMGRQIYSLSGVNWRKFEAELISQSKNFYFLQKNIMNVIQTIYTDPGLDLFPLYCNARLGISFRLYPA